MPTHIDSISVSFGFEVVECESESYACVFIIRHLEGRLVVSCCIDVCLFLLLDQGAQRVLVAVGELAGVEGEQVVDVRVRAGRCGGPDFCGLDE